MHDAPKLLVEWSSPWEEFKSALRPALGKSPAHLAGEASTGLFPYRGMLASWILELVLLALVIFIPAKLASMHPYAPLVKPKYDVIYFSGDELPQTEDRGGARAGKSGRAGGQEAFHRSQTIRVARGDQAREKVVDAPRLNLPRTDSPVANLLAFKPVPGPVPTEGLQSARTNPGMAGTVIPPMPDVTRDVHHGQSLNAAVVGPSPDLPQSSMASLQAPGSREIQVVPPPVADPQPVTILNPKLTLPSQLVVAPAPQVSRDFSAAGPGLGSRSLHPQVVPPPVSLSGGLGSSRGSAAGGFSGTGGEVVPPPVEAASLGTRTSGTVGLGTGTVVGPPPSVGGGTAVSGHGLGRRGTGTGGPMDMGTAVAAPSGGGGGSGGGTGIVVSNQPGSKVGVPGGGGVGAIAMSPSGTAATGLGGSGGGSGIGKGNGPGSGFSGEGTGAGKDGAGRGSDPSARGGISPYPGPGGAGNASSGTPAMPGVSVRGGSNVVSLPSFGSPGSQANVPGRSSAGQGKQGPDITIVATSRSGGAFNFYGALKGDRVYTIYINTPAGVATMEFADPESASRPYSEDLNAPQPMHADLPAGMDHSRLVIAGILDRSGMLRKLQVLEKGSDPMTSKVMTALPNWKFRPVLRGSEPVEVNVIVGFNIDTR